MRIDNQLIWCVRDPGPDSEIADCLWQTTIGQLPRHIIGTGLALWESEHTVIYNDEAEARADAWERLARARL